MSAEWLREAADLMATFGPMHEAIAEGLRYDADRLEAGTLSSADMSESIDLATIYLGKPTPP